MEVGKLFFGIFVTIVPVLEMLRAGSSGAFAPVVALVSDANGQPINAAYFWLTGMLSSFLDNAPTYLAFFNLAGNDPTFLMTGGAHTLMAISMGAVFMGCDDLHRQRAELHGGQYRSEPRCPYAEFLRLHGLVLRYFGTALPGADLHFPNVISA